MEEKRRLEARVAQLEEDMEEERAEVEQLSDRARKSAAHVSQAGLPWVWGFPWGLQWGFLWVWDGYGD